MKWRGMQCFLFLLAKKLVGFQWRAGTTPWDSSHIKTVSNLQPAGGNIFSNVSCCGTCPSPGVAAKCCKVATSECMKPSPRDRWHPAFTVPKWCQASQLNHEHGNIPILTFTMIAQILITTNNGILTGCTSEYLTMSRLDKNWFRRNCLQQERLSQAHAFFNCLKRRSWESNSLLIRSRYASQQGWKRETNFRM